MSDPTQTTIETADVLAIDREVMRSTGSSQFGITRDGFVPKTFPRLLAEKLALAQQLFGDQLDLTSGSAIRKLLEVSALEDLRTWSALATMYDDNFVISATGEALTRLGLELGIPRPHLEARGRVILRMIGTLPVGHETIRIPRGARMLTSGAHHVATDETVTLTTGSPEREVAVQAFYPGPEHNLDPALPSQLIGQWNTEDITLDELNQAELATGAPLVAIEHTAPLTGGATYWPDARYRELLLRAPRSLWTVDAIQVAVSLVPGVRQVQVRDAWGGLDIRQSIFGNFNFIERVFGTERDLGSPYYFTVLVAPTRAAIWDGPHGLRVAVESAIEDLRPVSIFPRVEKAEEVGIGVRANLNVRGVPLPSGPRAVVNQSPPALELKDRLHQRLLRYVNNLGFGDPVRSSEVVRALMDDEGVADARDVHLLSYPPDFDAVDFGVSTASTPPQEHACGINFDLQVNQIPVFVDDAANLTIV